MSTVEEVNSSVETVASNKQAWVDLPNKRKLAYLYEIRDKFEPLVEDWAAASAKVRGEAFTKTSTPYTFGPALFAFHLNHAILAFEALVSTGKPPKPVSVREFEDVAIAQVHPYSMMDKAAGAFVELWTEPNKSLSQSSPPAHPALCAILGAGNYDAPTEVLAKMFEFNMVVVYKPNPVNASAVSEFAPAVLDCLVRDNFLAFVSGGVEEGQALIHHPLVDEVMITGGQASYDRIVWGAPAEQAANKAAGRRVLNKPVFAELGACSPWIIVPGNYTAQQLRGQAEQLAVSKSLNGGAVCASPQILITDSDWSQKDEFLGLVREYLAKAADFQQTFYPGTKERYDQHLAACEGVRQVSKFAAAQGLPIIFAEGVNPDSNPQAFTAEIFGPILYHYELDSKDVPDFLEKTADLVNGPKIFGSLSLSVIIQPNTEEENKKAFQHFIRSLEWGSVGVNTWAGLANAFPFARWGAFPKHTPEDIQSGQGGIGNWMMIDNVQKTVIRTPITHPSHAKLPKPGSNESLIGSRLAFAAARPGLFRLLGVASAQFLGF